MTPNTLDVMYPPLGDRVARRIEKTSRNQLTLQHGTRDSALRDLEQDVSA